MQAQIWNNGLIQATAIIALPPLTELGICRRSTVEIRSFVTSFLDGVYQYTPSYTYTEREMPTDVHVTTSNSIMEKYNTSRKIFSLYRELGYDMVDVDLKTLSILLTTSRNTRSDVQHLLRRYIDELHVDTIPDLIHTHSILAMNICVLLKVKTLTEDEADKITDFTRERFIREIDEMKHSLRTWINDT